MVAPGVLQKGFQLKVPLQQDNLKCYKVSSIHGNALKSKRRLPAARAQGCGVVCSTGFDWKPIGESLKKRAAWRTSQWNAWKYSQDDTAKILNTIQRNALVVYSAVLGLVGFRLSTTFGMGWSIVGACILTTCIGYALCIRQVVIQENEKGVDRKQDVGSVLLKAQEYAFQSYSYRTEVPSDGRNTALMFVSSLFEPSPVYLLLNCWAVYAIGQCVISQAFGGGVLLMISVASLLVGRWLQMTLWRKLAPSAESSDNLDTETIDSTSKETTAKSLLNMLFTPKGTWGIGPIFNGVVWFGVLMLPAMEYPASPVVLAPLWTAIGAPALLLLEDIVSLVSKRRRDSKYALSMGPGLQLGSFLVGITCALAVRSLHLVAFQI